MLTSTSVRDPVAALGSREVGVLFPAFEKEFLVRHPLIAMKTRFGLNTDEDTKSSPQGQRAPSEDILVRLPSLRKSKWKVKVLQRWIGEVEQVKAERFVAMLVDATNSRNPPEQVELDLEEVSESDLPLLAEGATFYWSIGYRDTPGGQRQRISTIRFARHPRLKEADVQQIFSQADLLAAYLQK